ncbi:MAG: hypothetical protein AAF539_07795 [Planctomycetota bacterium]
MTKNSTPFAVALLLVAGLHSTASAQVTDSQTFTVNVPTNISISAPVDLALTHDETDANQSFPIQTWSVIGNTVGGVTVSLAVDQPFTHTVDPTYKRDVQLGLALNSTSGPGTWTISQASDITDYGANDLAATVGAASNGTGSATFDLSVSFITDTYGSFAAGTYETTVVGTVTANN